MINGIRENKYCLLKNQTKPKLTQINIYSVQWKLAQFLFKF